MRSSVLLLLLTASALAGPVHRIKKRSEPEPEVASADEFENAREPSPSNPNNEDTEERVVHVLPAKHLVQDEEKVVLVQGTPMVDAKVSNTEIEDKDVSEDTEEVDEEEGVDQVLETEVEVSDVDEVAEVPEDNVQEEGQQQIVTPVEWETDVGEESGNSDDVVNTENVVEGDVVDERNAFVPDVANEGNGVTVAKEDVAQDVTVDSNVAVDRDEAVKGEVVQTDVAGEDVVEDEGVVDEGDVANKSVGVEEDVVDKGDVAVQEDVVSGDNDDEDGVAVDGDVGVEEDVQGDVVEGDSVDKEPTVVDGDVGVEEDVQGDVVAGDNADEEVLAVNGDDVDEGDAVNEEVDVAHEIVEGGVTIEGHVVDEEDVVDNESREVVNDQETGPTVPKRRIVQAEDAEVNQDSDVRIEANETETEEETLSISDAANTFVEALEANTDAIAEAAVASAEIVNEVSSEHDELNEAATQFKEVIANNQAEVTKTAEESVLPEVAEPKTAEVIVDEQVNGLVDASDSSENVRNAEVRQVEEPVGVQDQAVDDEQEVDEQRESDLEVASVGQSEELAGEDQEVHADQEEVKQVVKVERVAVEGETVQVEEDSQVNKEQVNDVVEENSDLEEEKQEVDTLTVVTENSQVTKEESEEEQVTSSESESSEEDLTSRNADSEDTNNRLVNENTNTKKSNTATVVTPPVINDAHESLEQHQSFDGDTFIADEIRISKFRTIPENEEREEELDSKKEIVLSDRELCFHHVMRGDLDEICNRAFPRAFSSLNWPEKRPELVTERARILKEQLCSFYITRGYLPPFCTDNDDENAEQRSSKASARIDLNDDGVQDEDQSHSFVNNDHYYNPNGQQQQQVLLPNGQIVSPNGQLVFPNGPQVYNPNNGFVSGPNVPNYYPFPSSFGYQGPQVYQPFLQPSFNAPSFHYPNPYLLGQRRVRLRAPTRTNNNNGFRRRVAGPLVALMQFRRQQPLQQHVMTQFVPTNTFADVAATTNVDSPVNEAQNEEGVVSDRVNPSQVNDEVSEDEIVEDSEGMVTSEVKSNTLQVPRGVSAPLLYYMLSPSSKTSNGSSTSPTTRNEAFAMSNVAYFVRQKRSAQESNNNLILGALGVLAAGQLLQPLNQPYYYDQPQYYEPPHYYEPFVADPYVAGPYVGPEVFSAPVGGVVTNYEPVYYSYASPAFPYA